MKNIFKKIQNQYGFASIVEVVVTAVIFMLAATGVYSSIANLRPETEISSDKLAAAYEAQTILAQLRSAVDISTWDTGNLSVGSHNLTSGPYFFEWEVTDATYSSNPIPARKVELTVTY